MTKSSLELIVQSLNDAGARYLVVGGLAVVAHGYVRATLAVDLLIQLGRDNLLAALRALERIGYRATIPVRWEEFADPMQRRQWIEQKQMKVLKLFSDAHRETSIDVFVDDPIGFEDAFARMHPYLLADNLSVPVCSYQDLVKLKLLAGRPEDLVDLEQLRKLRESMSAAGEPSSVPRDPWADCTFEGAELATLRQGAKLSFAEKVAWLEEIQHLSLEFQEARRKMGSTIPAAQ